MGKKLSFLTIMIIIILSICAGIGAGILIDRKINNDRIEKDSANKAIQAQEEKIVKAPKEEKTTTTTTSVKENTTTSIENTSTSKTKTEKEQVEEVVNQFVKAVNAKDWDTVEKYSNKNITNELKKYNVSNMKIDINTLEKRPNDNGYYCYDSYDIDYEGLDIKDLGMGKILCIDNINGTFVVSTFNATAI